MSQSKQVQNKLYRRIMLYKCIKNYQDKIITEVETIRLIMLPEQDSPQRRRTKCTLPYWSSTTASSTSRQSPLLVGVFHIKAVLFLPYVLHLFPKFRLGPHISDVQLLKEDICRIEYSTGISSSGALFPLEVIHCLAGLFLALRVGGSGGILHKAHLGNMEIARISVNLTPDDITGLVDRNLSLIVAGKGNTGHVEFILLFICALGRRPSLRLLPWRLEALQFALLEESRGVDVCRRPEAFVVSTHTQEVRIGVLRDSVAFCN